MFEDLHILQCKIDVDVDIQIKAPHLALINAHYLDSTVLEEIDLFAVGRELRLRLIRKWSGSIFAPGDSS